MSEPRPFYDVTITEFKVGSVTVETEFTAIFDSGTAVTWLIEPYYTAVTTNVPTLLYSCLTYLFAF